jgi:hypothetical protein
MMTPVSFFSYEHCLSTASCLSASLVETEDTLENYKGTLITPELAVEGDIQLEYSFD